MIKPDQWGIDESGVLVRPGSGALEQATEAEVQVPAQQTGWEANAAPTQEGGMTMGMLRVISKHGDERVHWNEQDVQAGDAQAIAAIREAECIFAYERARGATAFRVATGKPAERLEQFDPQATQIILVPRVVGG